ncbi:MAG TPA: GNAT family N-acetyltransferase [Candidatus Binatia bacterium]|nr:GNAT family N-acetyltransferase [Candidatus Binatia bacterium]
MKLRVHAAIREIPRAAWDALVGDGSPFLEWTWLDCLEEAGCVAADTGWLPQHLTLWEGERLVGACPLYVKAHSLGEFVFDQGWAAGAARAGIRYYPKLLVGVPFTPVGGARLLAAAGHEAARAALAEALEGLCAERFSSAHVTFCGPEEIATLEARGWLRRTDHQYHWHNDGFRSFDDYLGSLRSKRRNQARREWREIAAQEVEITAHVGADIPDALLGRMFDLYRATVDALPWGRRYLNARFFALLGARFRERLCLVVARRAGELIAGTVNVQKGDTLYGRYWGALRPLRHLHFNVCYYAAIAHCVARGLARFEPGAGGEFKHLRGFGARETTSMHWIGDPRLRAAVGDFLERERAAVADDLAALGAHSALRRDRPPPEP